MIDRLSAVESRSMHGQLPVVWDRAQGECIYDPWGNQWLDFTSTIFVANAGHGNQQIVDAIVKTAKKPLLHAYNYPTLERLAYLEELINVTPSYLEKSFLVSAGTEAVEVAIKLMRLDAIQKNKRNGVIVTFEGNWHGRTMGAQQLSSNVAQRSWIGHDDPNIIRLPFPYPSITETQEDPKKFFMDAISTELASRNLNVLDDVAGFLLETYQGWGAFFYPKEFVQSIESCARENNALLVFDEMQSGFGRTGKLFGYEHYDVEPDLICCGKGASSSLPLAFVLGRGQLLDLPDVGSMSSTHSANPLTCAAGLANLREIQEKKLVERSAELGLIFHARLNELVKETKCIESIQGVGLVAGVITKTVGPHTAESIATDISLECMRQGLLVVHTGRESVKLAPPLTIHTEALDEGLRVFNSIVRTIDDHLRS